MQIKNIRGEVIYEAKAESLHELVIKAVCSEANLREANLRGANLSEANLSWADLSEANLSWADLSEANLSGADLSGADLSMANLSRADLSMADLSGADLSEANLRRANLRGANLRGAAGIGSWSQVAFAGHGECGRMLIAIHQTGKNPVYRCGCFYGSEQELREYIAAGDENKKSSRLRALEVAKELMEYRQ